MIKHTHFSIMTATKLLVIFLLLHFNFCFDASQAALNFYDPFEPLADRDVPNEPAPATAEDNAHVPNRGEAPAPGSLGKYFVYVNCTTCKIKSDLVVEAKEAHEPKEKFPKGETEPAMRTKKKGSRLHNRVNMPRGGGYQEQGEMGPEDYKDIEYIEKGGGHQEQGEMGPEDYKDIEYIEREGRIRDDEKIPDQGDTEKTIGEIAVEETTEKSTRESTEKNTGETTGEENTEKTTAEETTEETTAEETTAEGTEEGKTTELKTTKGNSHKGKTTEGSPTEENTTKEGKTTKKR